MHEGGAQKFDFFAYVIYGSVVNGQEPLQTKVNKFLCYHSKTL